MERVNGGLHVMEFYGFLYKLHAFKTKKACLVHVGLELCSLATQNWNEAIAELAKVRD